MGKAENVATAALAAFVEREIKAPMRRLGIGSRAALLTEWRRLRPLHDGWECAQKRYPAATRRIWALDILSDLPNAAEALTIDFCLGELARALPGALTRPLNKEEVTGILAIIEAGAANQKRHYEEQLAESAAQLASEEFAEAISGSAS